MKLLANVDATGDCWLWTGHCNQFGYGVVKHRGADRDRMAHLVLYEQLVGAVPDGLELDHLCRVRNCVNPDHLEPVTHPDISAFSCSAGLRSVFITLLLGSNPTTLLLFTV